MTIAYIAHPVSGNVPANIADIIRIVRKINMEQSTITPFVPYLADLLALDDSVPAERERGIENDKEFFHRTGVIDELWLTGDMMSTGMIAEEAIANDLGIVVRDFINAL